MQDSHPTKNILFCLIGLNLAEPGSKRGQSPSAAGRAERVVHNGAPLRSTATSQGATKML